MTSNWNNTAQRSFFSRFKKVPTSVNWFEIYEITDNNFIFYEPRHREETISNLVIGDDKAVLIDTGCGIGNLYQAVREITNKPVSVVNTHTHADHIGSNWQFNNVAMFEHLLTRKISKEGLSHDILFAEILDEKLIIKPWPKDFDPDGYSLPPFKVNNWLKEGDIIALGNRDLEVIHTPGEAPDHICLLDKKNRILFSGDVLLEGPIWTHLEGGSLQELRHSYNKLLKFKDYFDYIMPSHNNTWIGKDLLIESLSGVEAVLSGYAKYQVITDAWDRQLKKYTFNRFSILTSY